MSAERACARRPAAGLGRPLQAAEAVQDTLGAQVSGDSAPSWGPEEFITFWKVKGKLEPDIPQLSKNS